MRLVMFLTILCYVPFVTNAHHSTAANFTQEIISVEGVIERVRFQNPHSSVLIKNMDEPGMRSIGWLRRVLALHSAGRGHPLRVSKLVLRLR